jgi:serine/threonine-protein kinase
MRICPTCSVGLDDDTRICSACQQELGDTPARAGDELDGMILDGKYQLMECVGEGAMGWVYRGQHLRLQSQVAVKLMKTVDDEDGSRAARFQREARSASRLQHPHVLMIHDFGRTDAGLLFIVSEFLEGRPLSALVEGGAPIPLGQAVNLFNQVLAAVDEAHSQRVIHRDLKPDNIMLTRLRTGEDFVKVLDFGIARVAGTGDARLTAQGELCGTPAYMAPEVIRGKEATPRSDIYALGLILYELLTGRPPFQTNAVMEMLAMQLQQRPPTLAEAAPEHEIPAGLEPVVTRCLEKDPARRFGSVAALREALFSSLRAQREMKVPCRACHLHRPAWSSRCVSCGLDADAPVPPKPAAVAAPAAVASAAATPAAATPAAATPAAATPAAATPAAATPAATHEPRDRETASRETVGPPPAELEGASAPHTPSTSGSEPSDELAGEPAGWTTARTLHQSFDGPRDAGPGEPPLLGREDERREIESFLAGDRPILELLGPAGVGKSRLLQLAGERARARGALTLRTEADPRLGRAPWYPIRLLTRQVLSLQKAQPGLDELRRQVIGAGLSSDDVPGLADLFGVSRTADPVRPAVRVRETQAAALRAIRSLGSREQPVCLLLDDVDDYDGASLSFLRLLWDPALQEPGHLQAVLASERSVLPGDGSHLSLYLSPLATPALTDLVAWARPDLPQPEATARTLASVAEGNLVHALEALRVSALEDAPGASAPEDALGADRETPASAEATAHAPEADLADLDRLVDGRVAGLTAEARGLLRRICAIGNRAPRDLLEELYRGHDAADAPPATRDGFRAALAELRAAGFLQPAPEAHLPTGATAGDLAVSHPLVAQRVRDAQEPAERAALHREIFEALGRQGAGLVARARHGFEARLGEQALDLLQQAGELALRWMDPEGAALRFRQARHVARWELLLDEGSQRYLTLSLKLAEALTDAGHWLAAEMVFKEAQAASGRQRALKIRLGLGLGRLLRQRGHFAEAIERTRDALGQALQAGQAESLLQAYLQLAEVLEQTGDLAAASAELDEALLLMSAGSAEEPEAGPRDLWRLTLRAATLQQRQGAPDRARRLATSALEQARAARSLEGQGRSQLALARWLDPETRRDAAEAALEAATAAFRRLGDRRSVAECLLLRARLQPTRRRQLAEQARELAHQVSWVDGLAQARQLIA